MKILKNSVYAFLGIFIGLATAKADPAADLINKVLEVKRGTTSAMQVVEWIGKKFDSKDISAEFATNAADYVCHGRITDGKGDYLPGDRYFVGPKVADLAGVKKFFKTFLAARRSTLNINFISRIIDNYNARRNNNAPEIVKKHLLGVLVYSEVAGGLSLKKILSKVGLKVENVEKKWKSIRFNPDEVKQEWERERELHQKNSHANPSGNSNITLVDWLQLPYEDQERIAKENGINLEEFIEELKEEYIRQYNMSNKPPKNPEFPPPQITFRSNQHNIYPHFSFQDEEVESALRTLGFGYFGAKDVEEMVVLLGSGQKQEALKEVMKEYDLAHDGAKNDPGRIDMLNKAIETIFQRYGNNTSNPQLHHNVPIHHQGHHVDESSIDSALIALGVHKNHIEDLKMMLNAHQGELLEDDNLLVKTYEKAVENAIGDNARLNNITIAKNTIENHYKVKFW